MDVEMEDMLVIEGIEAERGLHESLRRQLVRVSLSLYI